MMNLSRVLFFIFVFLFTSPLYSEVPEKLKADLKIFEKQHGKLLIYCPKEELPVMMAVARVIASSTENLIEIQLISSKKDAKGKEINLELDSNVDTSKSKTASDLYPVAYRGLAIIVNPGNEVFNLNSSLLKNIFSGKLTNWKQVGGKDTPIHIYGYKSATPECQTFRQKFLDGKAAKAKIKVNSTNEILTLVSQDKNAISYMNISELDFRKVKALRINGIKASAANIKNGKYPLSQKIYLNLLTPKNELAKAFISFLKTNSGGNILEKNGLLPLK
jgi:phosphate transport system substrate-binding protein